jgi:putative sterol carrier protein
MSDYLEIQKGTQLPMQLAMSGRLRIVGDASIAMMMNSAFV